jgi:NADPH-dependent glutamate synthase beta subunit-like oxidoreductase/coenzyme F420-reducing hydrogenase delta subunit/Pyruvate/2-oxoacid:ferredoxin oxidoreductase delta subunit
MTQHAQLQDFISDRPVTLTIKGQKQISRTIIAVPPSPCTRACPAGVNVKGYVSLIAAGRFQEALDVVRDRNPFPGICGRVCMKPCEDACNRNDIDKSVAIRSLKRFVADYELENPPALAIEPVEITQESRVAIIGAGPAGLTAAHDLAKRGYSVTVFESSAEPGGMMVAGVPPYRLPREIISHEIDAIIKLGVNIKTKHPIKGPRCIEKLLDDGYGAVFVAVGAQKAKLLDIPGAGDASGLIDCLTFLDESNRGKGRSPGESAVIIGGGHSALDAAQSALRLGWKQVTIAYRRTLGEMPAHKEDVKVAMAESVNVQYLVAPTKVISENGQVTGLECIRTKLGKPDESGRRRPVPIKGSEFIIPADTIIPAISEEPDLAFLGADHGLELTRWNTIVADDITQATDIPGIFAGGDVTTGPLSIIDAVAMGHRAAVSIERYLAGLPLNEEAPRLAPTEVELKIPLEDQPAILSKGLPERPIDERIDDFNEIYLPYSETEAIAEAARCLRCGPCNECLTCVPSCKNEISIMTAGNGEAEILLRNQPGLTGIRFIGEPLNGSVQNGGRSAHPVHLKGLTAAVHDDHCRGCGDCAKACSYDAISMTMRANGIELAVVDENLCRGCGTCAATCESGAIDPGMHTAEWLNEKFAQAPESAKTRIAVFTCRWNGSLNQGSFHTDDVGVSVIQSMCAFRLEPAFILSAIEAGMDGVLLMSCSEGDCHYDDGPTHAEKILNDTTRITSMLGIHPARIGHTCVASGDRIGFRTAINNFTSEIRAVAEPTSEVAHEA